MMMIVHAASYFSFHFLALSDQFDTLYTLRHIGERFTVNALELRENSVLNKRSMFRIVRECPMNLYSASVQI